MEFWAQKGNRNLIVVELRKRAEAEPPAARGRSCVHRRRHFAHSMQAGRSDQERSAGFTEARPPSSLRRTDAGLGSRPVARGHARPGTRASRRHDAALARQAAVAGFHASAWPNVQRGKALDATASNLARRPGVRQRERCVWTSRISATSAASLSRDYQPVRGNPMCTLALRAAMPNPPCCRSCQS